MTGGSGRHAQEKPVHRSSATASIASSNRVMHQRVLWRDVPLRRSDYRGLAGRTIPPSVLFFVRPCSWGSALRRFTPATGGPAFLSARAHVSSASRVSPRLIFVGFSGVNLAFARLRLLGFAPVCGPFLRLRCRRSFLPWALPLAGVAGALLRMRSGSTPLASSASGIPRPHIVQAARPNPLMGFAGCIAGALQRIDGADASASLNGFESRLAASQPV
jgi:hypothetical protein